MKSSVSIWHLLHSVKSTVKISSIFVAFLENMNYELYGLDNDKYDIWKTGAWLSVSGWYGSTRIALQSFYRSVASAA